MRSSRVPVRLGVALTAGALTLAAGADSPKPQTASTSHQVVTLDQANWTPPPKELFRGTPSIDGGGRLRFAVVSGDPTIPGPLYTVRISCSAGYKVAPHWHPNDENIVVLRGALAVGAGDAFDSSHLQDTPSGGYIFMPKEVHHFALCREETDLLIYGIGPYQVNFLSPPPRREDKGAGKS